MCGIGVILDPSGTGGEQRGRAMARALRHRGPDGWGVQSSGPAVLVHTRLAIVDPEGGRQPLWSEDEQVGVVVNGEIYNHLGLRRELQARGHRFRTGSDSEVVVHLYEEHGVEFVRRLNGIFAIVLWDARRQRLLLARDPFGVKPLYWWTDGQRLAAASEVAALIAGGFVQPRLDPIALDHVLAWRFVPAPRTAFAGVSKLAPATVLVCERGVTRITSYREAPAPPLLGVGADELAGRLRQELESAVRRQLMSDVALGAFLSGGVDSAAVVAAASAGATGPMCTFTVGFPEQASRDERPGGAATAAQLGTRHHETVMHERDYAVAVGECLRHLEEPCGSQSAPALLHLSRFAARSVKVVLSGQGADEPLGGYRRAQAAVALAAIDRVPPALAEPLRRLAALLPRNEQVKRAMRVAAARPGLERLLTTFEITSPELRCALTGRPDREAAAERRRLAAELVADVADRPLLDQALYLDTRLFLPDSLLLYGDKTSMAASLEHRVPFLDLELMRFVERIPAALRMHRGARKWLYRRAVAELVPPDVLRRPKQGFTTPYDRWMRQRLGHDVARHYTGAGAAAQALNGRVVERVVAEHRRGRADHKRILWCLLEVAEWHRAFVEGAHGAPRARPDSALPAR